MKPTEEVEFTGKQWEAWECREEITQYLIAKLKDYHSYKTPRTARIPEKQLKKILEGLDLRSKDWHCKNPLHGVERKEIDRKIRKADKLFWKYFGRLGW